MLLLRLAGNAVRKHSWLCDIHLQSLICHYLFYFLCLKVGSNTQKLETEPEKRYRPYFFDLKWSVRAHGSGGVNLEELWCYDRSFITIKILQDRGQKCENLIWIDILQFKKNVVGKVWLFVDNGYALSLHKQQQGFLLKLYIPLQRDKFMG